MTCIILAAGYAQRLYPYTKNFPKALLKINGTPLLTYTLNALLKVREITKIYVVSNQRFYPYLQSWAAKTKANPHQQSDLKGRILEIINDGTTTNDLRLGSIGDIDFVMRQKKLNGDLLVVCSDKLFDFSLQEFVDFAQGHKGAANTGEKVEDAEELKNRHGCLETDSRGKIIRYQEKPSQPFSNIKSLGFYFFPQYMLGLIGAYLASGGSPDAPGHLLQWLYEKTPVYCWLIDGICVDIGTAQSYQKARHKYRQNPIL